MENGAMSKFLVRYQEPNYDADFTPQRISELTQKHVDFLRDLDARGILFLCGLLKDSGTGMIMLNAQSREEAEGYIRKDPFIENTCYLRYEIEEIEEANAGNNFLLDAHSA